MRARAGSRPTPSSLLAAVSLASLLAAGCELFSTKEFSRKPSEIRPFAEGFTRKDTVSFRLVEALSDPAGGKQETVLAVRILRFAKAPDSLQTRPGWTALSVNTVSDPAGTYADQGLCWIRYDSAGVTLRAADSSSAGSGTARYFPLKASASAAPAGADTSEFLVLPTAFEPGAEWVRMAGILEVARALEETDTLDYAGHLEESWRVSETVRGGGAVLSRGTFWYGATGLLKGEQSWTFAGRAADGSPSAPRELRRRLVRL
jgi:hypothetical protein